MLYSKIAHHLLFGQEKKISDLRLSWCTNNPKERGISCIRTCLSVNNLHSQHILQDILAFLFDLVSRGLLMYMQLLHLDCFLWRTGHLHNRPADSCYVARSRWKSLRAINEQNEKSDVIDKKNKYENTVINFGNLKTFFKGLQNLLTIFQPEWNLKIILYHYLSFFYLYKQQPPFGAKIRQGICPPTVIICSEMRTAFLKRSLKKTVSYKEEIMFKENTRAYFLAKWRLVSLLHFKYFCNARERC